MTMQLAYTQQQAANLTEQKFAYIIAKETDNVLTITLNRPMKKNAMNPQMMNEIVYAMNYAHYTPSVWVVVIQANGDIFTAGADLKAFAGQTEESDSTIPAPTNPVVVGDAFNHLHKPCIAKVHANVYAGGHLLICGCTHVVAAKGAQFSLPEVKRGIWPMQVMASLAPVMGARQLLDYCMRAKALSSKEALKLGLVTQVAKSGKLDKAVDKLVAELKTFSPAAIRLGLKAWDEMKAQPEEKQHQYLLGMLQEILSTKDAAEGLQAFMQKREPVWTGE